MLFFRYIIIAILLSSLFSCEKEDIMGEISGDIYYSKTRIPIPEVLVSFGNVSTLSTSEGRYFLRDKIGKKELSATKDGFSTFSEKVELAQGAIVLDIDLESTDFAGLVTGRISGNHTGRPEYGIRIIMLNPDDTESGIQDQSDLQGNYLLEGVPYGERMIVVLSNGIIVFQEEILIDSPTYILNISLPESFTFVDPRDLHEYTAIRIGNQTWMTENLAWLPVVTGPANGSQVDPRYYVLDYTGGSIIEAKLLDTYWDYGVFYNWEAANSSCPDGWHLPSDEDWMELEYFLGIGTFDMISDGARRAGGVGDKLKSQTGWINNGNGNNSSKFNVLPAGSRFDNGNFDMPGLRATFWTSTESSEVFAWARGFGSTVDWVDRDRHDIQNGLSVRCIKK